MFRIEGVGELRCLSVLYMDGPRCPQPRYLVCSSIFIIIIIIIIIWLQHGALVHTKSNDNQRQKQRDKQYSYTLRETTKTSILIFRQYPTYLA